MKKQAAQVPQVQKPARTLFGLSSTELETVFGGTGVIINKPRSATPNG